MDERTNASLIGPTSRLSTIRTEPPNVPEADPQLTEFKKAQLRQAA